MPFIFLVAQICVVSTYFQREYNARLNVIHHHAHADQDDCAILNAPFHSVSLALASGQ